MSSQFIDLPLTGGGSGGTVTSVGLTAPSSILTVSGSPVTVSGTLALSLATQTANTVWAGPTTGSPANPAFRALVSADIPALSYAPINNPTFTGYIKFGTYHIEPFEYDAGDSGAAQTLDWSNGSSQRSKVTTNLTYTFTNPQAGGTYLLKALTSTGGNTITWPLLVKWPGGVAPVFTTTPGRMDLFGFYYDGVNFFGSFQQNYAPTYVPPAGFSPDDIANLVLWTDAQVTDSIIKDGSNNVSQWSDLSINSNNLTTTGTARPVYNATGLNSLPTLVFDGSNDVLNLTTPLTLSAATIFLVVKPNNNGARQGWIGGNSGNSDFEAGQFVELTNGVGFSDFTQPIASTAAKYWTIQLGTTPSAALFHISSVNQTLTGSGGNWTAGLAIGKVGTRDSSWWVDGRISSVIIYSRNLSGSEITQVENYLAGYWGL